MIISARRVFARTCQIALICALATACSSDDDDDEDDDANFTLTGAGSTDAGLLAVAPSKAEMGIYQFAVSEEEDCSDPQVIINNGDTAEAFDMLEDPELGTGTIPDGTYPCVIMVMSPQLTVASSEDDGVCEKDAEVEQNVCGGNGSDGRTVDLEGEVQTCGDATDKAYLYITTMSGLTEEYEQEGDNCTRDEGDDASCNSFEPPTDDNEYLGVPLGEALVVKGDAAGVFTLGDLRMEEEGDENDPDCGLQRPSFTFTPAG